MKSRLMSLVSNKIAFRQASFIVLMTFVTGILFSGWQLWYDIKQELAAFDVEIQHKLTAVQHPAAKAAFHVDPDLAGQIAYGLFLDKAILSVEIIADLGADGFSEPLVSDFVELTPDEKSFISESLLGGEQSYSLDLFLSEEPERRLGILKVTAHPHVRAESFLNRAISTFFLGVLRNGIIAAIAFYYFYSTLSAPIQRLTKDWESINPVLPSPDDIKGNAAERDDELGRLVRQMKLVLAVMKESVLKRQVMKQQLIEVNEKLEERVLARTQELQVAKQEAELATDAKSKFLAQMSHEIRNPMNVVFGLCHLLSNSPLTSKQQTYVDRIHHSSRGMLRLLNDILDFSRIESGKFELERVLFSLPDLVESSVQQFAHLAREKQLDFSFDNESKAQGLCLGDPLRVEQIVTNLITNAIKFTQTGFVKVTLNTEQREQGTLWFIVSVHDSGIGLSREELTQIFDRFSQAESSTSRQYGGSGLGLSISSDLADLMGGVITVKSEKHNGACFSFECQLPMAASAQPDQRHSNAVETEVQNESRQALTILVVDDGEINRQILCELIHGPDVRCYEASNGIEAIDWVNKQHFDLVLMDIQMPEMNGLKAAEVIRQSFTLDQLPIIAVTANAFAKDKELALQAGMNTSIEKPIDTTELYNVLQQHLSFSPLMQPSVNNFSELPSGLVDKESALNRVGYNHLLYKELAETFFAKHSDSVMDLRSLIDAGDFQAAFALCHAISGSLANLGAQLGEQSREVEQSLSNENIDWVVLGEYFDLLTSSMNAVQEFVEQLNSSVASGDTTRVDVDKCLGLARQYIQEGNSDAEHVVAQLMNNVSDEQAKVLERIKIDLTDCEFDRALEQFDSLKIT
ncbi:response regulator [Vibrio aquaticus]|uniref:histidine kinase n=1 Tax=Vibrio aquaticus TaxID=2496559 RepID=A0A3S0MQT5_9VIBR|nr:ATP-binding protein [Vibrio aquaticus]RTZ17858.1 response regulator [Vibrio aquaticus]